MTERQMNDEDYVITHRRVLCRIRGKAGTPPIREAVRPFSRTLSAFPPFQPLTKVV